MAATGNRTFYNFFFLLSCRSLFVSLKYDNNNIVLLLDLFMEFSYNVFFHNDFLLLKKFIFEKILSYINYGFMTLFMTLMHIYKFVFDIF